MSWLDQLLALKVQSSGSDVGTRQTLNFIGATVADDSVNNRINVTVTGGGITALTGDVTASGSGSVAATVAKVNGVSVTGTPTSGQVIVASSGTASAWGNVPIANVTNTGGATGDLVVGSGTALQRLGIGSTGQVLTVSGGTAAWATASGANPAPAIDANHVYVWACNETSGTTLANTGASAGGNLTIQGTNYTLNSRLCCKNQGGFRGYGGTGSMLGAKTTGISLNNSTYTVEVFVHIAPCNVNVVTGPNALIWSMSNVSNDMCFIGFSGGSNFWVYGENGSLQVLGVNPNILSYSQMPHHLVYTYDRSSGVFQFYVDGERIISQTVSVPARTYTQFMLGNSSITSPVDQPFGGEIVQARISNIVRDQSYVRSTYATLCSM